MKKKLVSLFLALAMCLGLCVPAFAADTKSVNNTGNSYFGYTFSETRLENGDYVFTSYYEGEIQKRYTINAHNPNIYVQNLADNAQRSNYILQRPEIAVPQNETRAERWASLGFINYKTHVSLGDVRVYVMTYGSQRESSIPVEAPKNSFFDDVVATIVGGAIEDNLEPYINSSGYDLVGFAASVLTSILVSKAIEVIQGIIQDKCSDQVDSIITEWDFRGTPTSSNGKTVEVYALGETVEVWHSETKKFIYTENGITMSSWKKGDLLAAVLWDELYPSYSDPGVKSYTSR